MDKYNVFIKSYDDDDYEKLVTKEPVSYKQATAIDRGIEINLSDDYYTEIIEV